MPMRSLRIAVLDEELPYPLTSGKRIRTFNLLSRLAERHRITLICHRNADAYEAEVAEGVFHKLGIETVVVPRAVPTKSGAGFYARLAGNLLSPLPYSVATHTSPELVEAVQDYAAANAVDVWHCEWTPYAQVLRKALRGKLKRVPWVVVAHNVESMIWQRYAETEENPVKRWYIQRQWKKFEKFERWAYANATWTVAVSEEDANIIRDDLGGSEQTEVVDNGVDTAFFQPQRDIERDPYRTVFVGSLDWRPNQDAARLLMEKILPEVQAKEPRASLGIVGRNPPDWMLNQAKAMQGVTVHANVPDVRPYLATCGCTVVPLRVGGGSRLKILESLATATPVVSTKVGAEGLRLIAGEHLAVTDDETRIAGALLEAMRNPDTALDRAEEGRRHILREYDWAPLAEKLEEVWNVAVEQRVPRQTSKGN
jgi:glycosyltransferase involved in cell wall biosynthesis